MSNDKETHQCFACCKKFQHEEHVYGHYIPNYQIEVCSTCWQFNWDGWPSDRAEKIIKHLEEKGIPVPPMINGKLPRGD